MRTDLGNGVSAEWVAKQYGLPLEPPAQPVPPVVDQQVPTRQKRRLEGMSVVILAILREGPASNRYIAAQFPPSTAWRTRISDINNFLRLTRERVARHDCGDGLNWRWIEDAR